MWTLRLNQTSLHIESRYCGDPDICRITSSPQCMYSAFFYMYYILVSILCSREIQTNEADPLLVNRGQCNRDGTKQKQTYQLDLWVTVDFWHCHLVD